MATIGGWQMEPQEDIFTVKIQDNTIDWADSVTLDTSWITNNDLIFHPPPSGTITLEGEDADIVLNGTSLKKTLQGINDRLAILQVNPELEAEFDELHALGEQYRALEKKILEKKKVWAALNKT
jgi:hypothetical protein